MKLVKYLSIGLAATLAGSLISCKEESADSSKKETVIISSLNQEKQAIELEVKRIPKELRF